MYPSLPRWSDASSGVASTAHRVSKPNAPPRAFLFHAAEGTPLEAPLSAPSSRLSPPTSTAEVAAPQAKRAGRSGLLFVNRNVDPSAATASPYPSVSSTPSSSSPSATLPPAGVFPVVPATARRGGRGSGLSRQLMRAGGGGGAFHDGANGDRHAYATNRHGLVKGSRVASTLDAPYHEPGPLTLAVEGVQTGEGVVVEMAAAPQPHRRSLTGNGSGPTAACANPQDHLQVPQVKRQLEKANATVKSLTAANRRQKQEQDNQRAEWELQRMEGEARLRAVLTNARERESLLSQYTVGVGKRRLAEMEAMRKANAAVVAVHTTDRAQWEADVSSLRRALDAANAALATKAAKDSTASAQQAALAHAEAALAALRQSAAEMQQDLEEALAAALSSLNKADVELRECRQVQHQCNYLAQQCRLFIRQVCQPGFSVVKGPSLEPVEKERPEPTGFVLVPLAVLMHGYMLLPEGDQQEVIEHYEKEVKALH